MTDIKTLLVVTHESESYRDPLWVEGIEGGALLLDGIQPGSPRQP